MLQRYGIMPGSYPENQQAVAEAQARYDASLQTGGMNPDTV
jgi:hypothetical protein